MGTYKKLDRKASFIVTKLKNKVLKNGYYENLGMKEWNQFSTLVDKSDLTYSEKSQLKDMLFEAIKTI